MLSSIVQDTLPYHVSGVDSNDALYGGDVKFVAEVNSVGATLLHEIVHRIGELDGNSGRQFALAILLFERIVASGDLGNEFVYRTAVWSGSVASRCQKVDPKLFGRVAGNVVELSRTSGDGNFARLARELKFVTTS